ncbi:MAG: 7,8-didemethyl-8-hydroxy-5-deazariboflavin synthase CofG [Acidimicrobiales bacterium]
MCRLVLDETGLLPHANAGALTAEELAALRSVAPSQGMMVESVAEDLACHRNCPDKVPARRLATLDAAGAAAIPFTTGLLVGIGETRRDRIATIAAIADAHARHGHVQEVIVQNFLPKAGTAMHTSAPCPRDDFLETIALARLLLPADVHLQAPPNLSDDFGDLLAAGIDDWGGVSPITADHVNPERPWPALDRLREVTEAAGHTLAPRLTVYPEVVAERDRFLDPGLHFAVMDRADAEGLGRDDPGAVFVQHLRPPSPEQVDDGIEILHLGPRSTAWYSGASVAPPRLVGRPAAAGGAVREVLDGVLLGQQPEEDELVTLFGARGQEVAAVCELADELRRSVVGDTVTYVRNRNINYTNVCTFKCRFCGFSKGPLSLNLRGTPYLLTLDDIADRVREAVAVGATEVCLQGGIHPDFDGDYYIDVTRAVKEAAPQIHVHGFTALEVTEGAARLGEPLAQYLTRLRDAGLATLPGTAAEILDDGSAPSSAPTSSTPKRGSTPTAPRTRSGCDRTSPSCSAASRHNATGSATWCAAGAAARPVASPSSCRCRSSTWQRRCTSSTRHGRRPTFREALLMHAIGRIAYHGLIDNIQASWVKLGSASAAQVLQAGGNDLGGTLMDENISPPPAHARPADGGRRLPRAGRATGPHAGAAHHAVRARRRARLSRCRRARPATAPATPTSMPRSKRWSSRPAWGVTTTWCSRWSSRRCAWAARRPTAAS